jgi:Arc/MetJ-type ribon-helix-helix transcriptional regulator
VSSAKIAISLDPKDLRQIDRLVRAGRFPSRSKLLQDALHEKLQRIDRSRLAEECAKLSPADERSLADEGLRAEAKWPEY